jgi:AcrR family transcriptional regulator
MVQKSAEAPVPPPEPKRRGRPRAYDPDAALARAMEAFWKAGYAATTLDDLSAATGMNRPSLYAAFGDKQDIYIKAYRRYRRQMRDEFRPILEAEAPVGDVLRKVLETCRDIYLSGRDGPRGCLTVVTASSEAVADPEISKLVVEAIEAIDETFASLFGKAIARGELTATADPAALAKMTTAAIHTLAVRARAGVVRSALDGLIEAAMAMICGAEGRATKQTPTARRARKD